MSKPTIFFSHSSKDENILRNLKKKLIEKTGNTIDIFLSSDGQSIPFGKNWVHKIEDSLKSSKIMFVFLSPNSLNSNWIYFEAGFSYSKQIEVIPVGIMGIDLNQIPPPLNLLQGFNVTSNDGLNNIVSIINHKFDYNHQETFIDQDYISIFTSDILTETNKFKEISGRINYIKFELIESVKRSEAETISLKVDPFVFIKEYFKKNGIEFGQSKNRIITHGLTIENKKDTNDKKDNIYLYVDPILSSITFPIVKSILSDIYNGEIDKYFFQIFFHKNFTFLAPDYKVTSRFFGTDIKMSRKSPNIYEFNNIQFAIDIHEEGEPWLRPYRTDPPDYVKLVRIVYDVKELDSIPIYELLKKMFDLGIIYQTNFTS